MKDKRTIINEMVLNSADVLESKLEYNELVAKQYEEQGDFQRADYWRRDNTRIQIAIEVIREYGGCWG